MGHSKAPPGPDDYDAMVGIYLGLGAVALFATLLLLRVTAIGGSDFRKHPNNIVLWATVCDMGFALKFFAGAVVWEAMGLGNADPATASRHQGYSFHAIHDGCMFEGLWGMLFAMASIGWNLCWVVTFLSDLRSPLAGSAHLTRWFHTGVWGASVAACVILGASRNTGVSPDGTCWVKARLTYWKLFLFDVWLLLIFAATLASVVYAFIRLGKGNEDTQRIRRRLRRRHTLYACFFMVGWAGPLADHLAFKHIQGLTYFDAIGVSCTAWLIAMLRLSEPEVRPLVWQALCGCCRSGPAVKPDAELRQPLLPAGGDVETGPLGASREQPAAGAGVSWGVNEELRNEVAHSLLEGVCASLLSDRAHSSARASFASTTSMSLTSEESAQMILGLACEESQRLDMQAGCVEALMSAEVATVWRTLEIQPLELADALDPVQFAHKNMTTHFSTGKSSSFFIFAGKWMLKTVTAAEMASWVLLMPAYADHVKANPHTLLTIVAGLFKMTPPASAPVYAMLMQSVFPPPLGRAGVEEYDLKGSVTSRRRAPDAVSGALMDQDFRDGRGRRGGIRLGAMCRDAVLAQLRSDVKLLSNAGVMDYSLLLGIRKGPPGAEWHEVKEPWQAILHRTGFDTGAEVVLLGVIDLTQRYTWLKAMEHRLKSFKQGVLSTTNVSAVEPTTYARRFLAFMNEVFQ